MSTATHSRLAPLLPGDVLAVHTRGKLVGPAIRLGAQLAGLPHTVNHVAVAHHRERDRLIGIEVDPRGGVQWVNLAHYDNPWLLHNAAQPKTEVQRAAVCEDAVRMLHRPYDWEAIGWDALALAGLSTLEPVWATAPRRFVCSNFPSWLYQRAGLAHPVTTPGRYVTPGHWALFIETAGWEVTAA